MGIRTGCYPPSAAASPELQTEDWRILGGAIDPWQPLDQHSLGGSWFSSVPSVMVCSHFPQRP